ncbi:hypothetical protein [Campylobacter majalis]|uniref:hypothetical protein n=1 Tax=Campylobacter majalis TaxID=2790656 RepID=UPI003D69F9A4
MKTYDKTLTNNLTRTIYNIILVLAKVFKVQNFTKGIKGKIEYLSPDDVELKFGIAKRVQARYRNKRQLAYIKIGKVNKSVTKAKTEKKEVNKNNTTNIDTKALSSDEISDERNSQEIKTDVNLQIPNTINKTAQEDTLKSLQSSIGNNTVKEEVASAEISNDITKITHTQPYQNKIDENILDDNKLDQNISDDNKDSKEILVYVKDKASTYKHNESNIIENNGMINSKIEQNANIQPISPNNKYQDGRVDG